MATRGLVGDALLEPLSFAGLEPWRGASRIVYRTGDHPNGYMLRSRDGSAPFVSVDTMQRARPIPLGGGLARSPSKTGQIQTL